MLHERNFMQHIFFIVYDSIHNSVFAGQVIAPLIAKLNATPELLITIISFEHKNTTALPSSFETHSRLDIKILPRSRFLGTISLRIASWHLKRFLGKFTPSTIIARGPLAGWIAYHSKPSPTIPVIIQARGLCAEEYLFTHGNSLWHRLRAWQYAAVEKEVYGYPRTHHLITIEAVSPALKMYLHKTWHTPLPAITIAANDMPPHIPPEQKQQWRTAMRHKLKINTDAIVYVYAGSAHAWQCPEQSVRYAYEQWQQNNKVFLLILSQNEGVFKTLCTDLGLPASVYAIMQVPHAQMYQYLSAADYGLLFRQPHIINWVSRPTKLLEYQAVGLEVIHNGTIAYAIQSHFSQDGE